jgi:hypothetical protein
MHRAEENTKNNCQGGLDERGKAGIIADGPRALESQWTVQGHHGRIEGSLPKARIREGEK